MSEEEPQRRGGRPSPKSVNLNAILTISARLGSWSPLTQWTLHTGAGNAAVTKHTRTHGIHYTLTRRTAQDPPDVTSPDRNTRECVCTVRETVPTGCMTCCRAVEDGHLRTLAARANGRRPHGGDLLRRGGHRERDRAYRRFDCRRSRRR